MKKIIYLLPLLAISATQCIVSLNMGTISSRTLEISSYYLKNTGAYHATDKAIFSVTSLDNTGSITAGKEIHIYAHTFSGNGSLSAPYAFIKVKTLSFTGYIKTEHCIIEIEDSAPLNPSNLTVSYEADCIMLNRITGEILVKLGKTSTFSKITQHMPLAKRIEWFKRYTEPVLAQFKEHALSLSEDDIANTYAHLLTSIDMFFLTPAYAKQSIKEIVDTFVLTYHSLKDKSMNDAVVYKSSVLLTSGLCASAYGYFKEEKMSLWVGCAASVAGIIGLAMGFNPDYKDKYEQYCLLQEKLKAIF